MTRLRGLLSIKRINVGSKSEKDALILHSGGQDYVVRRPGEHSFQATSLDHLSGHLVEVQGEIDQQYFYVTDWTVLDNE
ncbi:hypothetical protein [Saccharopolyspora sp. ASAGF58]|uniref:hypothetical protein n=1 Tax=Saccharopolyspora sp. ASAGF58 TaxID=2719023 RepID=UPI001440242E|nr:hypothetical protein [Saccharopolyspora sp. ASAGF58]QIZ38744.1 hypothetical protein FDZ84_34890 [Saccharopolyspora sp. ASAGF58]